MRQDLSCSAAVLPVLLESLLAAATELGCKEAAARARAAAAAEAAQQLACAWQPLGQQLAACVGELHAAAGGGGRLMPAAFVEAAVRHSIADAAKQCNDELAHGSSQVPVDAAAAVASVQQVVAVVQQLSRNSRRTQPDGMLLQVLLGVTPRCVPVVVHADTHAAAAASIVEAAAAARLVAADVLTCWSAATGGLVAAAAAGAATEQWLVLLVEDDEAAVEAAAAALAQLAGAVLPAAQHSASSQQRPPECRIWVALASALAPRFAAATGYSCVEFAAAGAAAAGAASGMPAAAAIMGALLQAHAALLPDRCSREELLLPPAAGSSNSGRSSCELQLDGQCGAAATQPQRLLTVLQPLAVAAVAARCSLVQQLVAAGCDGRLFSMHGLAHMRLLLRTVAAAALAGRACDSISVPAAADDANSTHRHGTLPVPALRHHSHLQLDLQQLQKLLLWAVLGPSCCSAAALAEAERALTEWLMPRRLAAQPRGIRGLASSEGGLLVLGGALADAVEQVQLAEAAAIAGGADDSGGSDDGSNDGDACLLPLGLALSTQQLWRLLATRCDD